MSITRQGGYLPARLPGSSVGLFVARHMRDGSIVLQASPRKRTKRPTGFQLYQRLMFRWVGKRTAVLEPNMRATCSEWAKGTEFTWRDIAIMLMLGTYLEITLPDGTILESGRLTNPNPQYILDLITQDAGSMLYRNADGWFGLAKQADGYILTLVNGLPAWQAPVIPPTASPLWSAVGPVTATSTAHATKGLVLTPAVAMTVDKLSAYITTIIGGVYVMRIYSLSGATITALIATSGTLTAVDAATKWRTFDLPAPKVLAAGTSYAIVISRTDAGNTYALPIYQGAADLTPVMNNTPNTYWRLAEANPVIGHGGTTGANAYATGVRWTL